MSEIKIIKLPTIGQPYSIKTRKQGRTRSISSILDNDLQKQINKKKIKEVNDSVTEIYREDLAIMLNEYIGDCNFILDIKRQVDSKGIECLTFKQRMIAIRIIINEKKST
jgi:hypothetical protein